MTDRVIHRKVIVDVNFGHTPREKKLAMALTEDGPDGWRDDSGDRLRRELRRRLNR